MENHIVFGASGFIGSHVVEALKEAGKPVIAVTREGSSIKFLESLGVEIITLRCFDPESLSQLLTSNDKVYNCTANVHPHQSLHQYRDIQVQLTKNIMLACVAASCKRVIQLSSVEVYGEFSDNPMTETFPCRPCYDLQRSLLAREQIIQNLADENGMDFVILRPAGTYGKRSQVLNLFLDAHKKGTFPMIGEGLQKNSAIDTRDIARAMIFLADCEKAAGETYNIQGYRMSMQELKTGLDKVLNHKSKEQRLPVFFAHLLASILYKLTPFGKIPMITPFIVHNTTSTLLVDDSKLRKLGFTTQYNFNQTLKSVTEDCTQLNFKNQNYAQ